jgi:hypothetical protein
MGVKSTVRLTRREAINRYVDFRVADYIRFVRREAEMLTAVELEDIIERLNDKAKGGEGFENYIID